MCNTQPPLLHMQTALINHSSFPPETECSRTTLPCRALWAGTARDLKMKWIPFGMKPQWHYGQTEIALVWKSGSLSSSPGPCANLAYELM